MNEPNHDNAHSHVSGIGLRAPHMDAVLNERPPLPFLEVHAENHMGDGRAFQTLRRVREHYAVSIHGVGLSLGGHDRPDPLHLSRFADLVARIEPVLVSEHLAWCRSNGVYLNDLLPVRYDAAALEDVVRNIDIAQTAIRRPLLIENPSRYLSFQGDEMTEAAFLNALSRRTGCRILLDINNVYVSACNTGLDASAMLNDIDADLVGEFHLAGHDDDDGVLIDTHGAPVCDDVWGLYAAAIRRFGVRPTLLERDKNLPGLDDLLTEARRADAIVAAAQTGMRDAA